MQLTDNPFKKITAEHKYSNPWIEVIEDKIIKPNGSEGIYGKVLFKNWAIGIIPIDEEGYTYLVGQYRYPLDIYSWEIPMGGGSKEEAPLVAAKRELLEETGLEATSWEEIMTIHTSNSVTDETGYVFIAKNLIQGKPQPDDTEVLQIKRVKFTQALEMVMNGTITDSISVAGILKFARLSGIV